MKLANACLPRSSFPRWAVLCNCAGAALTCAFCASVALAVLPDSWVGQPYQWLVVYLNGPVDAPDNWALAFSYFRRIASVLLLGVWMFLAIGTSPNWAPLALAQWRRILHNVIRCG